MTHRRFALSVLGTAAVFFCGEMFGYFVLTWLVKL